MKRLALDVVEGSMTQFSELRREINQQRVVIDSRLDAFDIMLQSKKEIILSFADDIEPHPDDFEVLAVLDAIPQQEDIDHS